MKKCVLLLITLALIGCVGLEIDDTLRYRQFTSDDLSHLYFDKDTLLYVGERISYQDSIKFLLNDSDTIVVVVATEIHTSLNYWSILNIEDIYGNSRLEFDTSTGFRYADINVSRSSDYGKSKLIFTVNANGFRASTVQYSPSQVDTISLDTAFVLGKQYQDVYKFYPRIDYRSGIESIYFAKKYGYIRIEKLDGSKLELL